MVNNGCSILIGKVVIMVQARNTPTGQMCQYLVMGEIEDPIHHQKIPQNVVPLKVLLSH